MNVRPSTSLIRDPAPREMKRGVPPPTALKVRTGLLTPPTMTCRARAKRDSDLGLTRAEPTRRPFRGLEAAVAVVVAVVAIRSRPASTEELDKARRVSPEAGEDGRLELGVPARLGAPQLLDEGKEIGGVVGLER
jgi:hypothetical protein